MHGSKARAEAETGAGVSNRSACCSAKVQPACYLEQRGNSCAQADSHKHQRPLGGAAAEVVHCRHKSKQGQSVKVGTKVRLSGPQLEKTLQVDKPPSSPERGTAAVPAVPLCSPACAASHMPGPHK